MNNRPEMSNIPVPRIPEILKLQKKGTSVYHEGRLAKFYYVEGNENPIDFRNIEATGNPKLNRLQERVAITELWTGQMEGFQDFFNKWGIVIVIGLVILLIALFMMSKGQQPPNPATGG